MTSEAVIRQGVELMKFEEILGWKLLQSEDDRTLAKMWLTEVCRKLQVDDVR